MVELGTRRTTERVRVGYSPPTVARAVILPDALDIVLSSGFELPNLSLPGPFVGTCPV